MPNQYTEIALLCEDIQQVVFARTFLIEYYNIHSRRIRVVPFPNGKGDGKQFVREQLSIEIAYYRRRKDIQIALVVITDADEKTIEERHQTLSQYLKSNNIPIPQPNERIGIFIPKRNIETWVYFLLGETVEEETAYPHLKNRESECNESVRKLAQNCRQNIPLDPAAPPSLQIACTELQHLPRLTS